MNIIIINLSIVHDENVIKNIFVSTDVALNTASKSTFNKKDRK